MISQVLCKTAHLLQSISELPRATFSTAFSNSHLNDDLPVHFCLFSRHCTMDGPYDGNRWLYPVIFANKNSENKKKHWTNTTPERFWKLKLIINSKGPNIISYYKFAYYTFRILIHWLQRHFWDVFDDTFSSIQVHDPFANGILTYANENLILCLMLCLTELAINSWKFCKYHFVDVR